MRLPDRLRRWARSWVATPDPARSAPPSPRAGPAPPSAAPSPAAPPSAAPSSAAPPSAAPPSAAPPSAAPPSAAPPAASPSVRAPAAASPEPRRDHPYRDLPDRAFWRRAVGTRNPLTVTDLYRKKFAITPEDRIVTAGSCFAQHIARRLAASGFRFCDYEPAPPVLRAEVARAFNYGVYSARYCNIYTTRQLLQTFERAFGGREPVESVWRDPDGFRDPFRPALEPTPFHSEAELIAARESHLAAVRRVFKESDLFVFTLGLTEAWVSTLDGSVFPLCPGTAGGTFDPARHRFVNFTFAEVYDDLRATIGHLRRVNPTVNVMLTVSPVPLTATRAEEHVMVATSYSKSVLRGVAGQLAAEHDFVDYFPSYEIIAAPPMRGMFYEPNMRAVSPAGVDFVMRHFFAQHDPSAHDGAAARPARDVAAQPDPADDDVICEEMLLDQGL